MKKVAETHEAKVAKFREGMEIVRKDFEVEKLKEKLLLMKRACFKKLSKIYEALWKKMLPYCQNLSKIDKYVFSVGARSSEVDYVYGDAVRVVTWVDGEVEAFGKILSTREDYCAWIGIRSIASMLKKGCCDHVKVVGQLDFELSLEDVKRPLADASIVGKWFFT